MTLALVPKVPPLMSFITQVDERFKEPHFLKPYVDILERAPRGNVRCLCSCPIRHGKTWTTIAAIAHWLKRDPTLRIIYATFGIQRAEDVGKDIRDTCIRLGIKPAEGRNTIKSWRTEEGGGVIVMSAQQSRLGEDVDILIVDDPYEKGEEADKPEVRAAIDNFIVHYTNRLSRDGSCIIIMSRWHPDDAVGVRIRRQAADWLYIHMAAVWTDEHGNRQALAPHVRTLEELDEKRAEIKEVDPTERLWFAQWQNEPILPTTNYFGPPARYTVLPEFPGWRNAIGIDMAFTKGRTADWFAIAAIRLYMGIAYVMNIYRFKGDPREAAAELSLQLTTYGRDTPIYSYVSGPERIAIGMLAEQGIAVTAMQAETNKLWRAQRTINLWNAGKIMLPANAPWVAPFLNRAKAFRGVDGDDDDEVDALVSVINATLWNGGDFGPVACGRRRM